MVVSTVPGAMAFTLTPSGENAPAIDRVNDNSPALAAEYMEVLPPAIKAPTEITLITEAWSDSSSDGRHRWNKKNGPRKFTVNELSQASGVMSSMGRPSGLAALFTRMSIWPKCSRVASASRFTLSRSPMWVGTASASPPAAAISATAASQASALRLATTTLAP